MIRISFTEHSSLFIQAWLGAGGGNESRKLPSLEKYSKTNRILFLGPQGPLDTQLGQNTPALALGIVNILVRYVRIIVIQLLKCVFDSEKSACSRGRVNTVIVNV
jgi:hypothetical protein